MRSVGIRVEGLNKLLKDIDKKSEEIQKEVQFELVKSASQIESDAKRFAPTGQNSQLRAAIRKFKESDFSYTISVPNVHYAPYVEFGTGAYASYYLSDKSPEMRNYARQFYVNGKGRIPAQPFLFPAFEKERPKLLKRMRKAIGGR